MLNEYDIDLEDIESRLYSQVYHLNSQDDVDTGTPFVMSSDAPRKVSNYSISNIPTRSTRYFEKNPQDFEIGTNINETYVGPKTVNVESREKELDHNNSAVISRNKPSSISVDVNVTSNNPVQFLNQQVPNNLQQAIPQFLVNPINNIVVFPQNQEAIISVLEKQNRSIKRLQQNARKEEKRRQRKIQKQLFGSRKFQRQQQNNTNVSVMEETICLSDSDDDCCVYIPPVHPTLNLVDSDEEFKKQVESIVPATNSSSEDVVIIPNPSIEVIDIDAENTTSIPSNVILTPQKSYLPAERELLSTPESNDFLEQSVVSVSNEGNFNFSLHGADFSNEDFLRPAAPVNYEHDTESSCSASTCDLNTPSKVVKFSEVEFPSEKNDLFSDANLQKFRQSITPKRLIVTHNKLKQNKNDEGSSSDSDNDDTARKSKLLSKTLPTLSDIQFESSLNVKTDERKERKSKKKNKNNEPQEEPAKISKKRKSDQPPDLTEDPNLEPESTKKKKKKSKKHKEADNKSTETTSNDNNAEILPEMETSNDMKNLKEVENSNLPEVSKKHKKKKNITDFEETTIDQVVLTAETEEIDDNKKRKKKKRASSMTDENSEAALSEASVGPSEEGKTKKKKKKKNKSDIEIEPDVEQEVEATVTKKKKKKYRSESDPETLFKEDMTENTESSKKKKSKKYSKENISELTEDPEEPVLIKKKRKKSKEYEDIDIPTELIIKEKRKKSKNSEADPENIDNNNEDVVVEKIKHKKKKKHSESEPENLVYEETKTKHKKKKQKDLDNIDKFIEVQEELTEKPKRKNKENKSIEEPILAENTTIEQAQKTKIDKAKKNKDPEGAPTEELPNEKTLKKKKNKEATNAIEEIAKESVAVEILTKPDKKKKVKDGPSVLCLEDMELPIEEVLTEEKAKKKKKRVKNDSICSFASDNLDHSFSGNRSIFEEPRFAADENLEQNSRRIIIQQLINHQEKVLNLSEPESNLFAESNIEHSEKPLTTEVSLEPVIKSETPTTETTYSSEAETNKTVKEITKTVKETTKNVKENTLVPQEKAPVILPAPIKEEKLEPEDLPTTETDNSVNTESNTNIIIEGNVLITTVKQEEIVTLSTSSLPTSTTLLTTSVIPIAAGSAISEKENHVESINNKSNEDTPMCIISHVGTISDIKTEIISEETINSGEATKKITQTVDASVPDEKLNQDVKTNTNVVNQLIKETETMQVADLVGKISVIKDARETPVLTNENITTIPEMQKTLPPEIPSSTKTPPKAQTAIVSVIEDLTVVDEIFSSDEDENDIISIEDSDVESVLSTLDNVGHDIALNCSDKIIEITTDTPKTIAEKEESTTSFEERLRNFDVDVLQSKMSNNPKLWRVRSIDTQMYRSEPMRGKRCNKCREIGHMAIRCPNKVGPPKCSLCGNSGHLEPRCPNKLCNQCGERSDYHTNGCIFCRNYPNIQCNICKMMGHPDEKCPDVWRRYHLTTQNGSIVVPKNPRLKKRNDLWCCACAKPGHLEHNCRYYNRSYPPSDPSIHSYEDVYNPGHGFNNRDLNAPSTSAAAQYVPFNESVPPAPKIPPLLSDAAIELLRTRGYCSRGESRPESSNRNENRLESSHRNEISPEISGTDRNQHQQENKSLTVSVLKQLTTFDQTSYHFKLFTTKSPKEIQDYLYSEFQTLENLKISPMALFKQHKTMEKMLLKPSLSPSKLGQLKAHFRKCNMVILGQEALNGGTVHLNKLKNFVFHDTGLLDSYKRETLLLSYEYIFGKRKNDDCKYSYLLKLLVTKYGSKKY